MASPETLLRQAPFAAEHYFNKAIEMIDERYGEGYAKKNPALVASLVNAASRDYSDSTLAATVLPALVDALEGLTNAIGAR